ncbi:MAG: sigma-70 family RNA polymerase sigma factor [Bacilli bacterium]|nr:sigma-70 family RNA polymerase sigma factor [Bacilli bacterium]
MSRRKNIIKNSVTDNIIKDRFINFDYMPLSKQKEISLIKKLKLSYYNEASKEEKKLYLKYYFEEFPEFKKQYENSNEKEKLLEQAIENATDYRDHFIENNGRLVFSIVEQIFGINEKFEDYFQEGVIGMMKAIEKFDIEEENKFSTYAFWWIRQAIIRDYHKNNHKVGISVRLNERLYMYNRIKEQLEISLGKTPSNKEIAEAMGLDIKYIEKLALVEYVSAVKSLEEPISFEDTNTIGDLISTGEDFTNDVENKLLYMQIKDYLDELNIDDAARQIFNMRYGLDNEKTYTYNEIGKEFDISMAGIKKIESEILNMLQANIIHGSNKQKEKHYKVKILKHG